MYKQLVHTTQLNYNKIVKFSENITDVQNFQDIMILTVSNFVKK